MDAENGNFAHIHSSAHQHRADNAGKKNEIAFALNAQRLRRIVRHGGFAFLSVIVSIEYKIKRQENNARKGHFRQNVQRPEKRNAVQKAEKQGRIAQRRERPADVAHQKNKKNDGVYLWTRQALERRIGRMSSMEAPVVPMTEAKSVPMSKMTELTAGVPFREPRT